MTVSPIKEEGVASVSVSPSKEGGEASVPSDSIKEAWPLYLSGGVASVFVPKFCPFYCQLKH